MVDSKVALTAVLMVVQMVEHLDDPMVEHLGDPMVEH